MCLGGKKYIRHVYTEPQSDKAAKRQTNFTAGLVYTVLDARVESKLQF